MRRQWSRPAPSATSYTDSVGTENRMRRQWSWSLRPTSNLSAQVGTENRMRRQWSEQPNTEPNPLPVRSERRTGCGGSGASASDHARACQPGNVGTENRMRRQWSRSASGDLRSGVEGRNGEQDAEAVERLAVLI